MSDSSSKISVSSRLLLLEEITPTFFNGLDYSGYPEPLYSYYRKLHLDLELQKPKSKAETSKQKLVQGYNSVSRYLFLLKNANEPGFQPIHRLKVQNHTDPAFQEAFLLFKRNKKGGGKKHIDSCNSQYDRMGKTRLYTRYTKLQSKQKFTLYKPSTSN